MEDISGKILAELREAIAQVFGWETHESSIHKRSFRQSGNRRARSRRLSPWFAVTSLLLLNSFFVSRKHFN
jgi:hypothetical protein